MVSAASIVSRSRISPIEHDVGILAQDVLERALERLRCRAPTSRWLTRQLLCGCRNSIGSSIVMMCTRCSVLILSIIDASVVDLPEPVGPGDQHQAARLARTARSTTGGSPSSSSGMILNGIDAERAGDRAALHEDVGAEARQVLDAEREVELAGPPRTGASARRSAPSSRAAWCRPARAASVLSGTSSPSMRSCGGDAGRDVQVATRPCRSSP